MSRDVGYRAASSVRVFRSLTAEIGITNGNKKIVKVIVLSEKMQLVGLNRKIELNMYTRYQLI